MSKNRKQKTLTELKFELGGVFEEDNLITLINTIDDEKTFVDRYETRVIGTQGELLAEKIIFYLKLSATQGIDIQSHIESFIRYEKINNKSVGS